MIKRENVPGYQKKDFCNASNPYNLRSYLVFFLSSFAYGLASINRTVINQGQFDSIILNKDANQNVLSLSIAIQQIEIFD